MRIALVILNWNGRHLLERYLPRVISATTYPEADIIVADNASDDDSVPYLKASFPDISVIQLDNNYGFAGGYNKAIKSLDEKYEAVLLLNSDIAPRHGWIEPLVRILSEQKDVVACAPKILDDKSPDYFEYAGAAGGFLDMFGYPFCRGRIFDTIEKDFGQYNNNIDCLWVSGASLLIRRKEYLESGGLDEDFFAHMEEIDLCWRLRNAGWRIIACGKSSVQHLGGATLNKSNPHKTYLNFRNNLWMMIKNYNSPLWPLVILIRLILDGIAGIRYIVKGEWRFCRAIIKAHLHLYASLPKNIKKRNELKDARTSKSLPIEIARRCIVIDYHLFGRKTF
ncbi:MAG: glycosyltransferase family 2 protein [Marinilabiliaceae bacterium]|nr:glycosyltransferase family 2 protein [Marinilabiliaceae bacterium]